MRLLIIDEPGTQHLYGRAEGGLPDGRIDDKNALRIDVARTLLYSKGGRARKAWRPFGIKEDGVFEKGGLSNRWRYRLIYDILSGRYI